MQETIRPSLCVMVERWRPMRAPFSFTFFFPPHFNLLLTLQDVVPR